MKSRTFGLGQTNWVDKLLGIWGIFVQTISTQIGTVIPLSMSQPLFLQKISLYISIWDLDLDLDLNLGCKELGIQPSCGRIPWQNISQSFGTQSSGLSNWKVWRDLRRYNNIFTRHSQNTEKNTKTPMELKKNCYFVTKIVLTYCEKKLF